MKTLLLQDHIFGFTCFTKLTENYFWWRFIINILTMCRSHFIEITLNHSLGLNHCNKLVNNNVCI